jgi:hypothetical protein
MEQDCNSLNPNCAILNGTILNGIRFNISKTDLDLLKSISNCNSEKMNLCLKLNNSECNVQCDKNLALTVQKDKVGINNPTPLENLDVIGSGIFSQNLSVNRNLSVSGKITGFNVDNNDENSAINLKYLNDYLVKHYHNMQGPAGPQGIQGPAGPIGPQGVQGRSIKGDQGEKGEKGDKGENGVAGVKGENGAAGVKGENGEKGDKGDKGDQGVPGTAILDGIIDVGSSRLDKFILNSTTVLKGPIVNSYKLIKENTVLENIDSPLYIIDNSLTFEIDLRYSTDGMVVKFMNILINEDVVQNVKLFSSNSAIYNLNKIKVILPTTEVYDSSVFTTENPLSKNSSVTLIYLNLTNNPGWYILDQTPVNFYYPENRMYDSAGNLIAIQDF